MKRRSPPPLPKSAIHAAFVSQNEVESVIAELVAHRQGKREDAPQLWEFSDPEITQIGIAVERELKHPVNERAYLHAMKQTQRRLSHPRQTNYPLDLWHKLSQPEILEGFWPQWETRTGERGMRPGIDAKALLVHTATSGVSAHFNATHRSLKMDKEAIEVFEWIDKYSAAATGGTPNSFKGIEYEQAMKQVAKIAEGVYISATRTNVEIAKAIHKLVPNSFRWLAMDGTRAKAWCQQVGTGTPEEEAHIRRYAPNAGASDRANAPFLRGWNFVLLVDIVTGLPLMWVVWDANLDEARAMKHLLWLLYDVWPECPAEVIVADKAWDESWAVKWCLVNYNIYLLTHRTVGRVTAEHKLSRFDSEFISKFTGTGMAFCRTHDIPLVRVKAQYASRAGLKPGEASNEHDFRVRYRCPKCGDRIVGLKMNQLAEQREHWVSLSPFPHAKDVGMEKAHAFRMALLTRRNTVETINSALKLAKKLGLESADPDADTARDHGRRPPFAQPAHDHSVRSGRGTDRERPSPRRATAAARRNRRRVSRATAHANARLISALIGPVPKPSSPTRTVGSRGELRVAPDEDTPLHLRHLRLQPQRRQNLVQYKVLTQKDRFFAGKFDPAKLEQAVNSYADEGWRPIFDGDGVDSRVRRQSRRARRFDGAKYSGVSLLEERYGVLGSTTEGIFFTDSVIEGGTNLGRVQ